MEAPLMELITQGGTIALAAFAIFILNRVWADRLAEEKKNTEMIKQCWEQTRKALEENTKAVTVLIERMKPTQPKTQPRKNKEPDA
jgi:hypothetical protein